MVMSITSIVWFRLAQTKLLKRSCSSSKASHHSGQIRLISARQSSVGKTSILQSLSAKLMFQRWKYIANQEEHHRTKSFDDEFEGFMKRAGFQRFKDSEGS